MSRLGTKSNTSSKQAYYYCIHCINVLSTGTARNKHYDYCVDHYAIRIEMSLMEEDKYVKYHNRQIQFRVPFIMYTDFESILQPLESDEKDGKKPYTEWINIHVPYGFCVLANVQILSNACQEKDLPLS